MFFSLEHTKKSIVQFHSLLTLKGPRLNLLMYASLVQSVISLILVAESIF
ncbi:uncharacterized protein PHALS_08590 [Plasmopara halstedii]|uniref:Uncharacterized protein n=1 Tax=Plasmopara halstedii TaxID=4781 RepID=A0A0P1ADN2_PLAHL|nr:uncharacterized protein PHALS_08590 [Plasmopara halstedii]CEG38521.1 hypothetical protein PHALS_08590 [Plasmopara halstedii]|eukprot:XP_024574890.1 hypothetical protein PHALS_08590 [Plasmopara halstedii]